MKCWWVILNNTQRVNVNNMMGYFNDADFN